MISERWATASTGTGKVLFLEVTGNNLFFILKLSKIKSRRQTVRSVYKVAEPFASASCKCLSKYCSNREDII